MKILVVGSSNIDTTLYVKSLPKDGETISALSRNVALGGKGLNQAIAIKRAGGEITFLTSLGEDSDSNLVIEQLNKEEIPSYIYFKKIRYYNTVMKFAWYCFLSSKNIKRIRRKFDLLLCSFINYAVHGFWQTYARIFG